MDWRGLAKRLILRDGIVGERETQLLKAGILDDRQIDGDELVFLLELRHEADEVVQPFHEMVNQALSVRVLRDKRIDSEEVKWLRKLIYQDQVIGPEEYALLLKLEQQADQVCPEFYTLLKEAKDELIKPKRGLA